MRDDPLSSHSPGRGRNGTRWNGTPDVKSSVEYRSNQALPVSTHRNGNGKKPTALLEQWRIIRVREGDQHLVGIVSGHIRLREGARIVTSAIVALAADRSWAESLNTFYRLGVPGEGPLPDEWAERVDDVLRWEWGTWRVEGDEQ